MAKVQEESDSEDQEIDLDNANSGSEEEVELEAPRKANAGKKISDYERQRMKRIEENKARMEALGLKNLSSSFASSLPKQAKNLSSQKGKGKKEDEEEDYRPSEEEEEDLDSSSEDDEFSLEKTRKKKKIRTPKKPVSCRRDLDLADDDEALSQAIALSLQDSSSSVASQSSSTHPFGRMHNAGEGSSQIQEDMGKKKRKKPINSRVQMTEDELIIHFFQFDEAGKGNINLWDLQKLAAAHDFTWSENEMADMVAYFDSDGDGKLSLEDFRKIAARCNMIQKLETT